MSLQGRRGTEASRVSRVLWGDQDRLETPAWWATDPPDIQEVKGTSGFEDCPDRLGLQVRKENPAPSTSEDFLDILGSKVNRD